MVTRASLRVFICCLVALSVGPFLYGQATGSISGTVLDAKGAAVPGAKVTVVAPSMGLSRSAATDEKGGYIFPLLGVSTYEVQVELAGFQSAKSEDIRLQVDEHREVDFNLSPATVQTTVEVTATTVSIQ